MRCVPAHDFNVAKAVAWRSAIADDPPYQRESSVWSLDKQQLFVDSLLNGYDVPKIYLHDLRGRHPTQVYAVVDGRQRLTTIWRFLSDAFPLADDFRIEPANVADLPAGTRHPQAGQRFSQLDSRWQKALRRTYLAVVLIQDATEEDIEELFSRLNNGEPLNAAEKRNAMGGAIPEIVRDVAGHEFFTDRLRLANDRYQHLELASRLLLVEHADPSGVGPLPDLRSRALDAFVRENRRLGAVERAALRERVERALTAMAAVFVHADPLIGRQSFATLYYIFVRTIAREGTFDPSRLRAFLERFQHARLAALRRSDGEPDPVLAEFTHLMQHGTNEPRSLERRLAILADAFRQEAPGSGG